MENYQKYQKYAKISGFFFILAIVAGVAGMILIKGLDTVDTDLTIFSTYPTQNLIAILCFIIMAFACMMIAIPLFSVLKKIDEPMALSSVAFRIIETVTHIIAVLCILGYMYVSSAFVEAGAPANSIHYVLNDLIHHIENYNGLIGTMFFNLGFLMYSILFYKSKLVPRWLSLIGLVGSIIAFLGQVILFFGVGYGIAIIFEIPTIIFEVIVGFWLMIKGFDFKILKELIN